MTEKYLDQILQGDALEIMEQLPAESVDLVFADPPYNLQLSQELYRPNMTRVEGVDEDWDRFDGFKQYDEFTRAWLSACRRLMREDGGLWVIGTYHNIHRVGAILQDLGFWILNDVLWIKANPMPNFRGTRLTNAHEILIWVSKSKKTRYTFNHHAMKSLNGGKQMRSDWYLPLCTGAERIKIDGKKAHATQKPEALLYRVLLASTAPGDVVLDPFFGTGTTGAVAKRLGRHWIGIEKEARYVELAHERIKAVLPEPVESDVLNVVPERPPRVPFGKLLEDGLLRPGEELYFRRDRSLNAKVKPDGRLRINGFEGSIHQAGSYLSGGSPCNGWEHWYYRDGDGKLRVIDQLRELIRSGEKEPMAEL
jgi:modification methylase